MFLTSPDSAADVSRNVDAGEKAADGVLKRFDGSDVKLSELWRERPIVLETGSITCPVFADKAEEIDALAAQFAGEVDFYIMYVREFHPGPNYPSHQSIEEKMAYAKDLKEMEEVKRAILVDDIEGSVHQAYDSLPNSVYLIGKDGVVAYRADWIEPEKLGRKIEELLLEDGIASAVEAESEIENYPMPTLFLALAWWNTAKRGGAGVMDTLQSIPSLILGRIWPS